MTSKNFKKSSEESLVIEEMVTCVVDVEVSPVSEGLKQMNIAD